MATQLTFPSQVDCNWESWLELNLFCRYEWQKDGETIDFSNHTIRRKIATELGSGTLTIRRLESFHGGVYQCFASNQYGRSAGIRTTLKEAGKCNSIKVSAYSILPFGKKIFPCNKSGAISTDLLAPWIAGPLPTNWTHLPACSVTMNNG